MDYIVEQGMDLATIELEEETKVIFSFIPKIYAVKAVEGTVTVALRAGAEAGEDGVRSISDGEVTLIKPTLDEKIYINGTATVEVWAGDSAVESPFKKQPKGGGGDGDGGLKIFHGFNIINSNAIDFDVYVKRIVKESVDLSQTSLMKYEGYSAGADISYSGNEPYIHFYKNYSDNPQLVVALIPSDNIKNDILCNPDASIHIKGTFGTNYGSGLTGTIQMYIGNVEVPDVSDWVTVYTYKTYNSTINDEFIVSIKDINRTLTANRQIFFRFIHGNENTSYTTTADIYGIDFTYMEE